MIKSKLEKSKSLQCQNNTHVSSNIATPQKSKHIYLRIHIYHLCDIYIDTNKFSNWNDKFLNTLNFYRYLI